MVSKKHTKPLTVPTNLISTKGKQTTKQIENISKLGELLLDKINSVHDYLEEKRGILHIYKWDNSLRRYNS